MIDERNQSMKHRRVAVSATIVLIALCGVSQAERVAGVVFLDGNANKRLDAGEKGIAGVPVTDTLSFVVTDARGRYEIDAKADPLRREGSRPLVAISIPTGHWPTTEWFHRVKDVVDPAKTHFGLRRDAQELPFTFVHGTDSHVPRGDTRKRKLFPVFKSELKQLANTAKFCVLTGDLVNLPDSDPQARGLADFALFGKYIYTFPMPLFCTPGNHDACGIKAKGPWDKNDPFYGYGAYTHYVGPLRWSFNYANVHLVGLDFNDRTGETWTTGVLPKHAATWLEADLKLAPRGSRIFLFIHNVVALADYKELAQRYRVERIFEGHGHSIRDYKFAGIPTLQSGSLSQVGKGKQLGYRVVRVTEKGVKAPYTPLGAVGGAP